MKLQIQPIRCLITAGPTREFLDPVRFISNPSSGKMGYALAQAAVQRGWEVELVSGPVQLPPPQSVSLEKVTTGEEMLKACMERFPKCDMLIMTAAVTDMRPKTRFPQKQKKHQMRWIVDFEPVVDILLTLSRLRAHQTLVGFAAETERVREYATRKLKEKNLDWIVANDVSLSGSGFESDHNAVQVIDREERTTPLGPESKERIACEILDLIAGKGSFATTHSKLSTS